MASLAVHPDQNWTCVDELVQMRGLGEDVPPEGKKWVCCTACSGKGKVLVDDISRPESVPLSNAGSEGMKRYQVFNLPANIVLLKRKREETTPLDQKAPSVALLVSEEKRE
jgi:hypothetical protein